MERLEFFSKKVKLFGWLCVCLAFGAAALFETQDGSGPEVAGGWLGVAVCGFAAVFFLIELLRSTPRVVLSGEGFFDRTLGTSVIPWQSIVEIDTSAVKKSGILSLKLADEAQLVAGLSIQRRALASWQKMLGGNLFNTNLSTLNAPTAEVVTAILRYREHYAPRRTSSS